jgi:hypothetical protein
MMASRLATTVVPTCAPRSCLHTLFVSAKACRLPKTFYLTFPITMFIVSATRAAQVRARRCGGGRAAAAREEWETGEVGRRSVSADRGHATWSALAFFLHAVQNNPSHVNLNRPRVRPQS